MVEALRPAVFLDRDGVLNEAVVRNGKPYPPDDLRSTVVYPEAAPNISRLRRAGFVTVVVTNQPDVAKGIQSKEVVDAINAYVSQQTGVDALRVCWCLEGDDCDCYKPKPGMLLKAAGEMNLDLAKSFMVGDRWRDIGAGSNAGCKTVFVDRGYGEELSIVPDVIVRSLSEAVDSILNNFQDR